MSSENYRIVSQAIADTRKLFKKKKFDGWRNFCTSISPETPPSMVWRNIRKFKSAISDSSFNIIPRPLADQFLDHLAPPWVPEQLVNSSSPLPFNTENISPFSSPFSMYELKGIISSTNDSAPGADGISYSFFRSFNDNTLNYYLQLINSFFITGSFPISWKSQIVLPILKPNKSSSDVCSYRPIALSSILLKLAEHLIKNRLEWYIESNNYLDDTQYGFRKGRSTMDSLSLFISDIRLSFSHNESITAVFLDINSAYDNVLLSVLKKKLEILKVPEIMINFILNILCERHIQIPFSDSVLSRVVYKGLPQGSVLSPLLYNIYTYDLASSLNNQVKILQYADDLLIYYSDHSFESTHAMLSSSLALLASWMDNNGLNISPSKSAVVVFSRMRLPPSVQLLYDNRLIPVVSEFKFLGVILDSKLTGVPHCNYVVKRCEPLINMLRCLSGVWWGSHPYSMKLLYNALIRNILDYGSFLLEPGNVTAFRKLDSIQSRALRLISGAMKSSPINALQVENGEPPLHLRRQFMSDKFLFRTLQFKKHPLLSKLKSLSELSTTSPYWAHKSLPCLVISYHKYLSLSSPTHQSNRLPLFNYSFESLIISPTIHFNLIDKLDTNANIHMKFIIDDQFNDFHHLYSDASKHSPSECVGIGVYHSQYDIVQKIKLPPESSVFTGECYGILKALEYIRLYKLKKAVIFSDSLSALQALKKFPFQIKSHFPVIFEIRNIVHECTLNGYLIHFAWIPGHSGIVGNEVSDRLANEAVYCGDMFPYKNFTQDLISLPKTYLKNAWEIKWEESSKIKGRYYSVIQPCIPLKPWFFKIKLGKTVTSILIRMRLGHVCTPVHLAKLHIINNPICECGVDDGDLNHIFFSCPLLDHCSFLQNLVSHHVPLPTSIICLLYSNDRTIYKVLSSFININNIKI
ncbi:hypothetical protein ABMA27_011569 [Loxostege sticticalis]|uniref:RNA-directed DNA polymerase from mobile element jockey n=1 Tax=Loxostege sticticalis TaxID=481309 RepID=A0ABR3IGS3_LOXSC